jgi:enoyl-CoA hydratase/isomerase-like protein
MASGMHRVNLEKATGSSTATARTPGGANRAQQAVMVWREIPIPVIAAVHGVAFGGGFQLCLGADMRFVAPDAQLSVMEIKWGLVPDMAGIVLMRRLVRDDVARELILRAHLQRSGSLRARPGDAGLRRSARRSPCIRQRVGCQKPRSDPRGQTAVGPGCRGASTRNTAGRDERTGEVDWITQSGRGGAGESGEARASVRRMTRWGQ